VVALAVPKTLNQVSAIAVGSTAGMLLLRNAEIVEHPCLDALPLFQPERGAPDCERCSDTGHFNIQPRARGSAIEGGLSTLIAHCTAVDPISRARSLHACAFTGDFFNLLKGDNNTSRYIK
jgi:hypothetical protein